MFLPDNWGVSYWVGMVGGLKGWEIDSSARREGRTNRTWERKRLKATNLGELQDGLFCHRFLRFVLVVIFLIWREVSFTFCFFFFATFLILPVADRHSGLTAKRSSSGLGDSRPKSGEKSVICQDRSIKLFRHGRSKTASNLATRSRIFGHPELNPGWQCPPIMAVSRTRPRPR